MANDLDAADLNGDGKDEVVTFRHTHPDQEIGVWLTDGSGSLTAAANMPFLPFQDNMNIRFSWLDLADMNGDGKVDIVSSAHSNVQMNPFNHLSVLLNTPLAEKRRRGSR